MTDEERKQIMDEELEASEATMDDPPAPHVARRRPNRSEVMSLRLNTVELSALQRRAELLGMSASELARELIWQGLAPDDEDESPAAAVEALQRDVDRLRRQLVDA